MIVAFSGQKGGGTKSTTAICVACEAHHRGLRVLLVDSDPQGTSRAFHGAATDAGHEVPSVVAMGATMHKELPKLAKDYEIVIIDTPPRHNEIQRSALLAADTVILPCGGSASEAWALLGSLKLIEEAKKVRPELDARILLARVKATTALGRGAREVLAGMGVPIMKAELRDRVVYQEAIGAGQGVTTYAPRSDAAEEVRTLMNEILGQRKGARRRAE